MLALGRSDKNAAQVAEVADIALEDQQAARNVPALSGEADARVVQCDCSARDGTSTSTSNADTEPRYHDCSLFPRATRRVFPSQGRGRRSWQSIAFGYHAGHAGVRRVEKLVKASTVGIDLGIPHPSGAKNAFVADVVDFASQADYETYATHPDHLGVIKSIVPVIEPGSRSAIQFNIPQAGVVS